MSEPLPQRIIVDNEGVYWRDFGEFLSLVPYKPGVEGNRMIATYELQPTKPEED